MKLNERVVIITEENISRLSRLYGEIDMDVVTLLPFILGSTFTAERRKSYCL